MIKPILKTLASLSERLFKAFFLISEIWGNKCRKQLWSAHLQGNVKNIYHFYFTATKTSSTTTTATTTTSGECAGVVQEGDDCPTSWTKLSTGCYRWVKIVLKKDDIPLKLMLLLKDAIVLLKVPRSTNDPKRGGVFLWKRARSASSSNRGGFAGGKSSNL